MIDYIGIVVGVAVGAFWLYVLIRIGWAKLSWQIHDAWRLCKIGGPWWAARECWRDWRR